MKKILFVINNMNMGGIQKALLALLKALAENQNYAVSLFCCNQEGVLLEHIPKQIKILPENPYACATEQPLYACKKQGMKYYIFRMISSLWSKFFTKSLPSVVLCKTIGKIGEEYDVAISYSQPIDDHKFCNFTNEIVLNCTRAEQKITFVHCDFGSYGGNTKHNRNLYKKFDRIAAVSYSVGKRFAEIIPEISDKIYTVYNFCGCSEIEQLAAQAPLVYQRTSFITVARLSEEKGILRCIPIFDRLRKQGYDFEWHVVGGGPLKSAIEAEIAHYALEQHIFLEGEQLNPYRYMKNADYFLLPSFHEAAPVVFDESFTLGVPVLTTKTLSANEMIGERKIGLVCENDEESIYAMLDNVLSNNIRFNITDKPQNEICMTQFDKLCR